MKKNIHLIIISIFIFTGCFIDEEESTTSCSYQVNGTNKIAWKNDVTKSECKALSNGGWYSTGLTSDYTETLNYRCAYGTCPW